ncbi:MAG TPA: TIGR03668 family PPOX class F420-dependent oxidoreductase [Streptosporangiaceae bacterium]|jgi:PPOX class probable F420-dependent enzyme
MRLDGPEARRRFAGAEVARLATVGADGLPHLVPVTFAAPGPYTVVIGVDDKPKTTRDLRRLRNIAANPRVTLLADRYDADWTRLWWARADGAARVLTGGPAHASAWGLLRARYPQYDGRVQDGPVIAVDVDRWTGWAYGPG